MKRNVFFGTVFSAALAVGVSAQTGSAGSQSPSQSATKAQQVTVTGCLQSAGMATGTTTGAGGTGTGTTGSGTTGSGTSGTGTSGAATGAPTGMNAPGGSGAEFMLTNAKMGSGATATGAAGSATTGSGTGGTGSAMSGTSGTGSSASTKGNRFMLSGGNPQELRQYINSQVEISGTLQPGTGGTGMGTGTGSGSATGTGTATGSGSATSGSGAAGTMAADAQRLRVTSVKQIAASCSTDNR